jgi:hypothetical protein
MENPNQTSDLLAQHRPKSLPGMLNVLTILTFIGCGIGFLSSGYSFISSNSSQMEKLQEQREKMSEQTGFAKKFFDDSFDMAQVGFEYKNLLLGVGLVCIVLCLIGAIQMRKLKRSGFFVYIIGELAPVFVLGGLLTSVTNINFMFSVFFSFLFVILYATQLKHLVNK